MDVAVLAKAEQCNMSVHSHPDSKDEAFEMENCCSNESATVEGQDELKPSLEVYDLEQFLFLCGVSDSFLNLNEDLLQQEAVFFAYSPPLLVDDLCLRHQVYLI